MSLKLPSIPFYPGDWKKDTGVQALDYWTRGVWFEMLLMMWDSQERGKLLLNGKSYPQDALSRALGLTEKETEKALKTLLDYGVARKDDSGVIYNKRMVEDQLKRLVKSSNGAKGGRGNKAKRKLNESKTKANKKLITETESENEIEVEVEKKLNKKKIKEAFEEDWASLPRKDSDKKKAFIKYKATVGSNLEKKRPLFQEKIRQYSISVKDRDKEFIKTGQVFINQWEGLEIDELPIREYPKLDPRDDPLDPLYEPDRNGDSNGQSGFV